MPKSVYNRKSMAAKPNSRMQHVLQQGLRSSHPQTVRAHPSQVQNSAGGYSFPVSDEMRVTRFLILGCEGGSYYASEKKLTLENAQCVARMAQNASTHGRLVDIITDVSVEGRAPKQDSTMMALAIAIAQAPNTECKRNALAAIVRVCRIPTHLASFLNYLQVVSKANSGGSGWGRGTRGAVKQWYAAKTGLSLAMAVTKFANREGWTIRDVLRKSHVHPKVLQDGAALAVQFAVNGSLPEDLNVTDLSTESQSVVKFLQAVHGAKQMKPSEDKGASESQEAALCALIMQAGLVREHVPSHLLNSRNVWRTLLLAGKGMPTEAMMRNLPKMSAVGVFEGPGSHETIAAVVARLNSVDALKAARIHPMKVLVASKVYASGKGIKGSLSWAPVPAIVSALNSAFKLAFGTVQPSGKRMLLALDVSGSMECAMNGTPLTCRDGAAAMAVITASVEKDVRCLAFTSKLVDFPIRGDEDVEAVVGRMSRMPFGGTDCSLPMLWALQNQVAVDCFVVYTDCETWAGSIHPFEALKKYRQGSGIHDAKMAVVGMSSNGFSIADPDDAGMMDFVGFDTATPDVLGMFARGEL